jgi:hypothetical protein
MNAFALAFVLSLAFFKRLRLLPFYHGLDGRRNAVAVGVWRSV